MKKLCKFKKCNVRLNLTMQTLGKCKYCNKIFCTKHRYEESHNCENIEKCKEEKREKHREIMLKEKCVPQKIVVI